MYSCTLIFAIFTTYYIICDLFTFLYRSDLETKLYNIEISITNIVKNFLNMDESVEKANIRREIH